MRSWKPHAGKQRVMAFSPDGETLATAGGSSGNLWLWHPASGELKLRTTVTAGPIHAVSFSAGGELLAVLAGVGDFWLYRLESGAITYSHGLPVRDSAPESLALSPADGQLVAASATAFIRWTDPADARLSSRPDLHVTRRGPLSPPVHSICFTPDGSRLLVGAADLELWPPDLSGATGFVRTNKRNGIKAIAVTRDGSRAAVVIRNTVRICSLESLKFERTLHWGSDMVYATSFTPDGRTLLTAGADGTVRFWDVATGVETRRFDWGIGKVSVAAFAPDGLTCAAGSDSGQIVVWDVDA